MTEEPYVSVADWLPDGCSRVLIDNADYQVVIHRTGNVYARQTYYKSFQATFDENAREAAEFSKNHKMSDQQKVTTLPVGMYYHLKEQGIADDPERFARWMNDSDNSKFRVNNLKV
ncbi:hypothetical protein G6L37_11895 [Agrobacterium rubi]|uniref:hypothetical protein n=1 Tax=Agrobacterium rubi TaxID=28099 RepID=UPI001572B6E0|nr:hypothetical protein [Agrobacterium rubi]NTF06864.1 hypothetical protein [Agrobacterium rubi]NTF19106.1 hypothetical protein [Agrobacterium rubi]NTF26069.1 hypothetical protein [Agrobacterium rubi]